MADFDPRGEDATELDRRKKAPRFDTRGASNPDAPSGGATVRTVPLLVRSTP